MQVPISGPVSGYFDVSFWNEKVVEDLQELNEAIDQENRHCAELASKGLKVQNCIEFDIVADHTSDNVIGKRQVRPQILLERYAIANVDEKIQGLVEWKKVAYAYIFEQMVKNIARTAYWGMLILSFQTNIFTNAELINNLHTLNFKNSIFLRSRVYRICENKLIQWKNNENDPALLAVINKTVSVGLSLLLIIFYADNSNKSDVASLTSVAQEALPRPREKFAFSPSRILEKAVPKDLSDRVRNLNAFHSKLLPFCVRKASLLISKGSPFLSALIKSVEPQTEIAQSQLLLACLQQALVSTKEPCHDSLENPCNPKTLPSTKAEDPNAGKTQEVLDKFTYQVILDCPEENCMVVHEDLINYHQQMLISRFKAHMFRERGKISPMKIYIVKDDDWGKWNDLMEIRALPYTFDPNLTSPPTMRPNLSEFPNSSTRNEKCSMM